MLRKRSSNTSSSTPSGATKKTAWAHKLSIAFAAVALCLLGAGLVWGLSWPQKTVVTVNGHAISAQLATTSSARAKGLSGVANMPDTSAMLFVFASDHPWQFWMKDMRFNLDIVWVGKNKRVVWVVPNATPASYPHVFTPSQPARYVLELNAGAAQKFRITTGTQLSFTLP